MAIRDGFLLAVALAAAALTGSAQNARDAFWSANDLISVTPNPAVHNRPKVHSPSSAQKSTSTVTPNGGSVNSPENSRTEQLAQLVAFNGYGVAPHPVRNSENRLGLRCSLLLRGPDKEYSEATPGAIFHSGDHIRLSLLANQSGYLYVIQKGSSGTWAPIYPSPSAGANAARIEPGQLEMVPGGTQAFAFDQNPGAEKLFVILSRTPIDDIDRVIRNLSHGGGAPAPPPADASTELEAKNVISDAFIQRLASRDLTLVDEETVDSSPAAAQNAEKAVYVVAKKSDAKSSDQVVLSLDLRHE
jgi:hypothetical protein